MLNSQLEKCLHGCSALQACLAPTNFADLQDQEMKKKKFNGDISLEADEPAKNTRGLHMKVDTLPNLQQRRITRQTI